ncbi:GntR family transcriptional regulator [Bradyrhizobium sp. ORS 375]|uniref:GntR family transcriptional regulator n=1 Tax=Bradyrhizobium sp. (strain ORS 375) TaxID=566679 RepID=UPI0007E8D215|nr:GntR family transcriptional regulator [Bradyrhizobium sp. ORS 375]
MVPRRPQQLGISASVARKRRRKTELSDQPTPSKEGSAVLARRRRDIPLHHQVFLVLQDEIAERRYASGEALPTEAELAALFNVSRVTIRAALDKLDELGLIERRQGIGTFVRELARPEPLTVPMMDLAARNREIVRTTRAHVVEFEFKPAPRHVREHFQARADDLFQRAVRIRTMNDWPIMQVTTYIPEAIGRQFGPDDMEGGSLYAILQRFGITFASGEQIVTAAAADPIVAARLNVAIGAPLLKVVRIHFDSAGRPIQHFELLAPPATYELRMPLKDL